MNSKYFYIERRRRVTWFEALHKCRELGANLATFENKDDLDAVTSKLSTKKCHWMSLTNFSNKSEFISFTSGQKPNFTIWAPGEPNNLYNREHCVELVEYKSNKFFYNDLWCYRHCKFICETKLPTQINIVVW